MKDDIKKTDKNVKKNTKKNMKKINQEKLIRRIMYLLIICIIIFVIVLVINKVFFKNNFSKNNNQDGSIQNTLNNVQNLYDERETIVANLPNTRDKEKFGEEKDINNGIVLKDSVLYQEGEMTIFMSKLYNGSHEDITELAKEISLLDKNGEEMDRTRMIVSNVKVGDYSFVLTQILAINCKLEDIYDFRVEW